MLQKHLPKPTTDRILDVAEELFATCGFDGATLREITRKAGANLASVNYHYRDKESLFLAVVRRRLQAIDEVRRADLRLAEERAGDDAVPLETIFDILARPLFELGADQTAIGRHGARLLGRSLVDPLPFLEPFLTGELQPLLARFGQAARRHVPRLSPEEFLWRLSFVVGAMHHSLATLHRMNRLSQGICRDDDGTQALASFVRFAVAGLTASRV